MANLPDIKTKGDIEKIVDMFYYKVREDDVLSPVFAMRIHDDGWQKHLQTMYSFWNTVLFATADYRGNPFIKHIDLNIEAIHFDRWISLFQQTIDHYFEGEKATEMKLRAAKMRLLFENKLETIRMSGKRPLA